MSSVCYIGAHDNLMVGFHIENAIYGPLYYGYPDDGAPEAIARNVEGYIMEHARDTVMVLLKASPEAIRSRMTKSPHRLGVVQEEDIETVLRLFEEEFAHSLIRYKFQIDTTEKTPDETFGKFLKQVQPLMRQADQVRILARQAIL